MNRRGFIAAIASALAGVNAWARKPKLVTSTQDEAWQYSVRFITRDGHVTEPVPCQINEQTKTITVSSMADAKEGDVIYISAIPIGPPNVMVRGI